MNVGKQVPSCFIHCVFVAIYVKRFDQLACKYWSEIRRLLNYPIPFCDLDQMRVALKHFCRIICFYVRFMHFLTGFKASFGFSNVSFIAVTALNKINNALSRLYINGVFDGS